MLQARILQKKIFQIDCFFFLERFEETCSNGQAQDNAKYANADSKSVNVFDCCVQQQMAVVTECVKEKTKEEYDRCKKKVSGTYDCGF